MIPTYARLSYADLGYALELLERLSTVHVAALLLCDVATLRANLAGIGWQG